MPIRKFLVASSVARLIQRELGSEWRVEGYLNGGDTRRTHVVLEGDAGHLMLEEEVEGNLTVEDTVVPRRQAEALLVACVGRLDIDRITMAVSNRPAILDRISSGGKKVDVLTVTLDDSANQRAFYPPAWVGREVTDGSCDPRTLATAGIPTDNETSVSNSGLEALIDLLERGALNDVSARHVKPGRALPPVHDSISAPEEDKPAPQGHSNINTTPPDHPLRELLSGVLSKTEAVLPPEGSEALEPDYWGPRRKR